MNHSEEFENLVAAVKPGVREISVAAARVKVADGTPLIDVREDSEWNVSRARGALHIGRGVIERDIVSNFPNKNQELILYCGGGYRSALAAESLQKMGYTNVFSMSGGWTAWTEAEAPTES